MTRYPLVFIEWEDSAQPIPVWQYVEDYQPRSAIKCASVGWLVHNGEDVKGLAQNMGGLENKDNAQMSGVIHIPARCIINLVQLEEPELTSS